MIPRLGERTMDHRPQRRSHDFVRIILGGLILVGVIAVVAFMRFSRATSVHTTSSGATRKLAYRPRERMDTIGFASVLDRIPRAGR